MSDDQHPNEAALTTSDSSGEKKQYPNRAAQVDVHPVIAALEKADEPTIAIAGFDLD